MANRRQVAGERLIASEAERARLELERQEAQKEKIAQTVEAARTYFNNKNAEEAATLAFKCLQESAEIFGEDSIELMPLYFELADSNIEIGRHKRAEGFLIGAHWTLLKHQPNENDRSDPENSISKLRSRLLKSFGSLFTKMGNYEEAQKSLTENIYLESVDRGPEHYLLSGSYYLMGKSFIAQHKKSEALNFYRQMYIIWKKFLLNPDSKVNRQAKKVEIVQGANEIDGVIEFVNNETGEDSDFAVEIRQTWRDLHDFIDEMNKREYRQSMQDDDEDEDYEDE